MSIPSWDVILLEEVEHWYFSLDASTMAAVTGAIDLLELEGPTLGRPTVDKVNGSKFHSMKELRPAATSIRILFIFDRRRRATCCSAVIRRANGRVGTRRTFRSPRGDMRSGWRKVNDDGTQLA
jgi:hypothetical protein